MKLSHYHRGVVLCSACYDEVRLLHPKFSDCLFCNLLALVYLTL